MIKEQIKEIKDTPKDIRSFSRLVGGIFTALGLLFMWRHPALWPYFFSIGLVLVVLGEIVPKVLRPVYFGWMILSVLMGFVMSRVILSIVFFLVLTPISLVSRIFKAKYLDTGFRSTQQSYWIAKNESIRTLEDYGKQY